MATPYVEIVERESVVEMLELYKQSSIKLVDGYLFVVAKIKMRKFFLLIGIFENFRVINYSHPSSLGFVVIS